MQLDVPAPARDPGKHRKHGVLAKRVGGLRATPSLLIYGDSITEAWGRPAEAGLLRTALVGRYGSAMALGIGGGTATELLWRLRHGEIPTQGRPRACVVHIGINDLGQMGAYRFLQGPKPGRCGGPRGYCAWDPSGPHAGDAENVYFAIREVLRELCAVCPAPVVVTALFPTGRLWPQGPFGETVPRLNSLLSELAAGSRGQVEMVSCPQAVLSNSTGGIDHAAMPDFLHPALSARKVWVSCLTPVLDRLIL